MRQVPAFPKALADCFMTKKRVPACTRRASFCIVYNYHTHIDSTTVRFRLFWSSVDFHSNHLWLLSHFVLPLRSHLAPKEPLFFWLCEMAPKRGGAMCKLSTVEFWALKKALNLMVFPSITMFPKLKSMPFWSIFFQIRGLQCRMSQRKSEVAVLQLSHPNAVVQWDVATMWKLMATFR